MYGQLLCTTENIARYRVDVDVNFKLSCSLLKFSNRLQVRMLWRRILGLIVRQSVRDTQNEYTNQTHEKILLLKKYLLDEHLS